MLDLYIDFKCAGSYLALDPTLALAERTGVKIAWHPFSTAERDKPAEGADAAVIASHHATREASKQAIHHKYASLRGIDLKFPPEAGSADHALGALAEIEGDPIPFIRACFAAYWEGHKDLDNPQVVAELLQGSGARHSGDLAATRDSFAQAQASAEEAGIVDAPGYRIADQVFVGRQHLPWIEELAVGSDAC
jgi:2-hydroxychromene-2-carboxylate isomerase